MLRLDCLLVKACFSLFGFVIGRTFISHNEILSKKVLVPIKTTMMCRIRRKWYWSVGSIFSCGVVVVCDCSSQQTHKSDDKWQNIGGLI